MKKIFILSWPSWVWKTTIYQECIKKNNNIFKKVITTTTRTQREYEKNWKDYYFVSMDVFRQIIKNDEFIEYVKVHENFYGSTYYELKKIISSWKIPLYIVDPQWVKTLKNKLFWMYDLKTIFILPPNQEELKNRLIKRWEQENSNEFNIRIKESLIWLEEKHNYDYNIVNDNLENAIKKFEQIINS